MDEVEKQSFRQSCERIIEIVLEGRGGRGPGERDAKRHTKRAIAKILRVFFLFHPNLTFDVFYFPKVLFLHNRPACTHTHTHTAFPLPCIRYNKTLYTQGVRFDVNNKCIQTLVF